MVHGVISLTDVISIHAPAKGATDNLAGSDISILDFNPRSREGSDKEQDEHATLTQISIHAPAKGATGTPKIYL